MRKVVVPSFYAAARSVLAGCVIGLIGSASVLASEDSINPTSLINDMSMALKNLNYEGTFVHVQGAHMTSMHILHSSDSYGELERLVSLDGEQREVIRNNSLVTCIWPGSQSVVVSKSKPRDLLPRVDETLINNNHYRFSLEGLDRIAGLQTYTVSVEPTDAFRYGYRFWIDVDTKMLLRSMLLDGPNKTVEQVMFTSIEYPNQIDPERFEVASGEEQVSWLEPKKAKATNALDKLLNGDKPVDKVSFSSLPTGYSEVSESYSPMPISNGPISHVMLSDGMASVSVYVEYVMPADQGQASVGLSNMGAMNAFGLSTDNAFITAVGDVPAATVKAIAAAVVLRE